MENSEILVLGIVSFLLIVGFTIFILVMAFRNKSSSSVSQTIDYTTTTAAPVVSRINWTEVNRGFVTNNFPPCYDLSAEARKMYTILNSYNLEKKYMMLLDVYSILLCQNTQIRARACSDTFLNDRLADLNTYGGNANDQNAVNIVKSVTNLQNNKMGKLLVMATNLIEKQMSEIQKDNAISASDKQQMTGHNSLFYRNVYDFMNKRCP
jgi:hypothetical protein